MPKSIRRIFKEGLSYGQARLGSLTADMVQPWGEIFHPASPWPTEYIGTTEDENFHKTFQRSKGTRFNLFLTKLFKINASSNDSEDTSIVTAKRIIQTLVNYEDAFIYLTKDSKSAQEWLQKRFNRSQDVYIIVRTETFASAHVRFTINDQSSIGGDISIPLTNIVQPLPVVDGVLDVGGGFKTQKSQPETAKFTAVGDRIYVVEYRKISLEWLQSTDIKLPPSSLSGILFRFVRSFDPTRGEGDGQKPQEGYVLMKVENDVPEFDEGALEDEQLETFVDQDSAEEVEYVFSLEDEDEDEEGEEEEEEDE